MNVYPLKCRIRNEGTGPARVDVYDDIGEGGWFCEGGLTAKDFAAQVAGIKGALEVHINSAGGDVFDGIAIGNAIRGHSGDVTTVVDGLAASIASVIAQAGQHRVVRPGSMVMIHDASGMCIGDAAEMTKMTGTLDKVSDNIAAIYAERAASGTAESWRDTMRAETWYTAEEAVAAGLADEVAGDGAELPAGLDVAAFTAMPGRIAAALRSMPAARGPETTPAPPAGLTQDDVRAIVRDELHVSNAAADESSWDGPAAMSWASSQDDPQAAFKAICAGEKTTGEPGTQAHWALPHHKHSGDPPNRKGVSSALGYLDSTQDLKSKSAAQSHLEAHQKAMGSGGSDDHTDPGFEVDPVQIQKALEEAFK